MSRRRFLPKYVTSFRDRHGRERLRFRRKGFESHYFASALGTEEFRVEYRRCLEGKIDLAAAAAERAVPGSINDLVCRYYVPPERLGPTATTQAKVRAVIDKFRDGREERMVAEVRFEHIDAIIARKRQKTIVNGRPEGGVEAARKLRKELIRLFDFAIKIRLRADNPARQADKVKVAAGERSKGRYTWSEEDIAAYRVHHKLGSTARLALELLLWTDQRRSDILALGRQHIRHGYIHVGQSKTGKELAIAVAPQLTAAIVAMPNRGSHLCFLVNAYGKPFSKAGFGNKFREWCDEAGLPKCTAHGLRKATMRRMAELGLGNQTMKAVSGHSKDDEVALYTAAANQKRMARDAIIALSEWEMSNPAAGLDIETA